MGFRKIEHQADLCVVGGGLAGMCAAIAAARSGVKVVLVHDRPVFGGNASSEIRMWICGAKGTNNRETGIVEEIELTSLWRNPDKLYPIWDGILFEKVKNEKNIVALLNCSVCDAETEGNRIRSVTGWQTTTQQWHTVTATYFADCSGDSVLAPLCGAEYRIGREAPAEFGEAVELPAADRKTMGMSCLIQMRKTDRPTTFIPPVWATKLPQECMEHRTPQMDRVAENFWYLELGGNRDSIHDTEEVRDELVALAYGMVDYIKNSGKVPDGAYWELDWMGFLPGKRESRRMVGPYILTQRDISNQTDFPDVVAYGGWPMDNHHPDGFYHIGEPTTYGDTPSPYGIPYRCLYSVNVENLFFAGRNISASHLAMSSSRVMATCAVMGEAVGTAAAIAARNGLTPHGVYLEKMEILQQKLMENGCFLPRLKRNISEICKKAALTCEGAEGLERLRNGIDRNNVTYGNEDHRVTLPQNAAVTYTLEKPAVLQNLHLQFDTDLDRKTLEGSYVDRLRSMRSNRTPDSIAVHLPQTLIKGYRITAVTETGEEQTIYETDCNVVGCVNHPLPKVPLKSISFIPCETWGSKEIRIFSFDVR